MTRFMDFSKVDWARRMYEDRRHHERYRQHVEEHGLMCQEGGGAGQYVEDVLDFGDSDVGSIPCEIPAQCGWCEGTGRVTRHARGLWLWCKREEKRRVA